MGGAITDFLIGHLFFLIVTFFVEMYNWLNFIDYINTILINIISLRSLLRFNPFGVISRSELLRLARRGHISHRLHLWLFTFNPFGVGTLIRYQQNPL
jgi:hypothetical protein